MNVSKTPKATSHEVTMLVLLRSEDLDMINWSNDDAFDKKLGFYRSWFLWSLVQKSTIKNVKNLRLSYVPCTK